MDNGLQLFENKKSALPGMSRAKNGYFRWLMWLVR